MTLIAETLDRKLHEWNPAKAAAVEKLVSEIISLADAAPGAALAAGVAGGWPPGFLERVAGSLPDFPDIDSEGGYEARQPLT